MLTLTPDSAVPSDQVVRDDRIKALLSGCEQGDEKALEELYNLCAVQLYSVHVRILKRDAIAEEALQDTFIKIWQKAGTYNPTASAPMTWLYSLARHHALDLLRRRSRREDHETQGVEGQVEVAPDLAKTWSEMNDDAQALMTCLEQLPADTQRCLVGAYCEGYSHDELAEQVDRSVGTVKSWIRRGLISLRKCLDEFA